MVSRGLFITDLQKQSVFFWHTLQKLCLRIIDSFHISILLSYLRKRDRFRSSSRRKNITAAYSKLRGEEKTNDY